jgi:hypothetical protein
VVAVCVEAVVWQGLTATTTHLMRVGLEVACSSEAVEALHTTVLAAPLVAEAVLVAVVVLARQQVLVALVVFSC